MNSTSMNNIQEFVTYEALSLGVGDSVRLVCPVCGARHERSFQITRTQSNLLYRCWRVACGVKGVVGSRSLEYTGSYGIRLPPDTPRTPVPRPFPYSTQRVPLFEQAIVWHRYRIGGNTLNLAGVLWAEEIESLVFPCYDISGGMTGYATKRLSPMGAAGRKSDVFWDTAPPRYFPLLWGKLSPSGGSTAYLVEDCLSCLKLWQTGVTAIALLGTKLDDKTALEISKVFRKVVFCLDNDATAKSVELSRKYNLLFDKVSILVPPADPKDMQPEELESLLYAGS